MNSSRFWLIILLAVSIVWPGNSLAAQTRRPNIILILADDLGINDLSCYGRADQPTPNLDRLAQQGMRFTQAYSAQPVCSPTRAALLTGKTPARLKLTTFLPGRADAPSQLLLQATIEQQLPAGEKTLADRLKSVGYVSICIGKWHLGAKGCLPTDRGFDAYFPGQALTTPSVNEGGKGEVELTSRAEKFLDENKDRPFFLYLAHNNPHIPLEAKKELIEKHRDAFNPTYAAMIETLDESVGRILAKVKDLGIADDTLIIFTSDNGGLHVLEARNPPPTFNRPYRAGKGFLYEGGIRVPLIVAWPGKIKAGVTSDVPFISTDWTPTLLSLAGISTNDSFDGENLAKVLQGETIPSRTLHWHFPHYTNQGGRPAGAIREGNWKLIEHYENGQCELFDLSKDVSEENDLAEKQPNRIADLRGKLEKWRRSVGAVENRANPNFNINLGRPIYHDLDTSKLPTAKQATILAEKLKSWRFLMDRAITLKAKSGNGAVLLLAKDARVHGTKLRYEDPPQKDTLGFWVNREDWLDWEFEIPHAGSFEVELLQACGKGSAGSEIEIAIPGQTLSTNVVETGHFQRFIPRTIGTLHFPEPGRYTLSVKAKTKPGAAVMDLRRITLSGVP